MLIATTTHYMVKSYGAESYFMLYDNGNSIGLIAAQSKQSTNMRWYGVVLLQIMHRARADE